MSAPKPHDGLATSLDATATRMGVTDREERKALIKEAMAEAAQAWLDARYKEVGKWSTRGLAAAGFAALVYFVLTHTGWVKP